MDAPPATTLFEQFLRLARSPLTQNLEAIECGEERWSYADIDAISTGLAAAILKSHGERPTVAVVSENHPYVFATFIATWKLGGILAPIDYHTPKDILMAMLLDVRPTCALVPEPEASTRRIVSDLGIPLLPFDPKAVTILALSQQYIDQTADGLDISYPHSAQDLGMYMHTSSASTIANIKCVPLTHANIFAGSLARLGWWKKTWPDKDFHRLQVLGWSPWSHIIGVSHDLGAALLLTGGCYTFAVRPSSYHSELPNEDSSDVIGQLLSTASKKEINAFAGVPWILEGIMAKWKGEDKDLITNVMSKFKIFGAGGAATSAECLSWAKELDIPVVIDIGMTEVGGPLFHNTIDETPGWPISECLVPESELTLVDENGEQTSDEGELHISSPIISKGYLRPNYTAFTVASSGRVTLRTGDIYQFVNGDRLVWKGRKEDYVQMSSGETLDPRFIEKALDQSRAVHRSCVVGDKFLRGASHVVCAILELSPDDNRGYHAALAEVTREIANVNRSLAPPLRISWSRVLILNHDQHIPITRKGAIFRKKLEEAFGDQLGALLSQAVERPSDNSPRSPQHGALESVGRFTEDSVAASLVDIVSNGLHIEKTVLKENHNATFAELGMNSSMATKMVNAINDSFSLSLPLNTCHTHVDLNSLTEAVCQALGLSTQTTSQEPSPPLVSSPLAEEVVVVGQAVRLPGDIGTPDEFWDALMEKREDIIGPIPDERWDHASFYRPPGSDREDGPCDITLQKSGFINITDFDHTFFGISSAEAYHVAPNIRLTLEIAFEALENANIPLSQLKGSDMGVFVAANMDEGHIKLLFSEKGWGAYSRFYGTGVATSTACGRISYLLDVHGPSYTIDTACSSGLVGFDQAVRYLQSGQGESAIVCGANTHSWPGNFGFLTAQKMTSPNSRCATYTNVADGYVPSEGAAAVILKTKRAALRDGDKIIAVVKSTSTMHDGRSQGLVAPNVKAQISMQKALLRQAELDPAQLDFIEAHGTGTSLGDLIEIEGINDVFKGSHSSTRPLIIGAAKTCVGHTENVAGLVGLIKVIGSFTNTAVPGLVHLTADNMNPSLNCEVVPLTIPHQPMPLLRNLSSKEPLRGMVERVCRDYLRVPSSRNQNLRPPPSPPNHSSTARHPKPQSKSTAALQAYIKTYVDFCQQSTADQFESICYTSCVGREHYRYRFSCVAESLEDLIGQLQEALKNKASTTPFRNVAFAFPGQGSQYQGMARDLACRFPAFQRIVSEASAQASSITGLPILSYLLDAEAPQARSLSESDIAQVCIFVYQYSVGKWLQDLGPRSLRCSWAQFGGDCCSCYRRSFSFDAALESSSRGRAFCDPTSFVLPGMAAIGANAKHIFNAESSVVVSGALDAIDTIVAAVKQEGLKATRLDVNQAFHSPYVAPAMPRPAKSGCRTRARDVRPLKPPSTLAPMVGNYRRVTVLDADYWFQNVPLSTKSSLSVVTKRGKCQATSFLAAISQLFRHGLEIDFVRLLGEGSFGCAKIPSHLPFPTHPQLPHLSPVPKPGTSVSVSVGRGQRRQDPFHSRSYSLRNSQRPSHRRAEDRPWSRVRRLLRSAVSSKSLDELRFHRPLVAEHPDNNVFGEIKGSEFVLWQGTTKVCSGKVSAKAPSSIPQWTDDERLPLRIVKKSAVYECFKNVSFGSTFRNIHEIKLWDDHADAIVSVVETSSQAQDRVRKLDACMHMFGARWYHSARVDCHGRGLPSIFASELPLAQRLPASTFLFGISFPSLLDATRSAHRVDGGLLPDWTALFSCEKYSVAFLPSASLFRKPSSRNTRISIVLDLTTLNAQPGSDLQTSLSIKS
ncbi:ketoacyl-synt-domain-containing protein [Coprinellus micaceus]|uniref:Ketoacyl-synt-domain-containing protein n=1 Tax=Coprinellus micaceus TaxID=71717 RepID=A0A4Y7SV29_COPMI|nr:ketoacyl-synt-domain-containing protein [Coprinellus micaceus]